jgi:putative phosphoribosyl transferase
MGQTKCYLICMVSHSRAFADRAAAGIALARELQREFETWSSRTRVAVLALPRGGVPVAYEAARVLHAPLDVLVVRKVGLPQQPEVAIGAVASGGVVVHDKWAAKQFPDLTLSFEVLADEQRREVERREELYRRGLAPLELRGKTVVLVDDGLATGSTMLAAIRAARKAGAATVVAAAPVASPQAAALIREEADATVFLQVPATLFAVGEWYWHFEQLDDTEVCRLLDLSRRSEESLPGDSQKRRARG